ncbi:MAG: hypothetical protein WC966_10665 [Bradymonadales bacterium]
MSKRLWIYAIWLLLCSFAVSCVEVYHSPAPKKEEEKDPVDPNPLDPGGETPKPVCGNNIVESGEDCDGQPLKTCESLGFFGGELRCGARCKFDKSLCNYAVCGNGVLEAGESCDDGAMNGTYGHCKGTCLELGPRCGDGVLQKTQEDCDGEEFGEETCRSLGFGSGEILCDEHCKFDKSACVPACRDGNKECVNDVYRVCVDGVWSEKTCEGSTPVCTLEGCVKAVICGDGIIDAGEDCDSTNLNNKVCSDFDDKRRWEANGQPSCVNCELAQGSCKEIVECGDGIVNGDELCDGDNLNHNTCASFDPDVDWEPDGLPSCEQCKLTKGSCVPKKQLLKEWSFTEAQVLELPEISVVGLKNSSIISGPYWSTGSWGDAAEADFLNKYLGFDVKDVSKRSEVYISIELKVLATGPHKLKIAYFHDAQYIGQSEVIETSTSLKVYGPYPIPKAAYQKLHFRIAGYNSNSSSSGTLHIKKISLWYI